MDGPYCELCDLTKTILKKLLRYVMSQKNSQKFSRVTKKFSEISTHQLFYKNQFSEMVTVNFVVSMDRAFDR